MPRVVFEPTIPVFERPNIVRALDHAVFGTGIFYALLRYSTYTSNYNGLRK
jgi:hypothetical protein